MTYIITLQEGEDGDWIVEYPVIPGCLSQGNTKEEAVANIREAIVLSTEVRKELGLPLTVEA
jgi:predicted RNase H-like HicB family nuclease